MAIFLVSSRVLEFKIEMTANKMTAPSTHLHNPPPALSDYRKPVQNVNLPKQQKNHKIQFFFNSSLQSLFSSENLYSPDFWFNTIPLPASYFATYLRKYISKFGKIREYFPNSQNTAYLLKNPSVFMFYTKQSTTLWMIFSALMLWHIPPPTLLLAEET